jgi:hypothetical protein
MKSSFAQAAAILCAMSFGSAASGAEHFRRVTGAQISSTFAGMEMTDGVHWADLYERSGKLSGFSMGRKTAGRWRVQKDQLCLDREKEEQGCYQVWISGKNVELRRPGSNLPQEGVLQRPVHRQ